STVACASQIMARRSCMSVDPSCKRKKLVHLLAVSIAALLCAGPTAAQSDDDADDTRAPPPRSPITPLSYIIGENRSFANVYGTDRTKHPRTEPCQPAAQICV